MEELGVASIKIGQILSTRTDLLAPAYQVELAKLQDSAPPEPTAIIRDVLATELGSPIETVFAVFDPQPMAAASIGQVHAATLPDGSEVIVKIRRPGVVEQIELDLQILEATVRPISRLSPAARRYDPERFTLSRTTSPASSVGGMSFSAPPNLPNASSYRA